MEKDSNYRRLESLKNLYENYIPADNLDDIYKLTKQIQPIPEIKLNDMFRFNNLIFDLDDTLYSKTEQLGDDYSFEDAKKDFEEKLGVESLEDDDDEIFSEIVLTTEIQYYACDSGHG